MRKTNEKWTTWAAPAILKNIEVMDRDLGHVHSDDVRCKSTDITSYMSKYYVNKDSRLLKSQITSHLHKN